MISYNVTLALRKKKMRNKLLQKQTVVVITACFLFLMNSCKKDGLNGIDYHPNLAIPIVKSTFTIKDILATQQKNNNIQVNPDGFINLVFSTKLFSKKAEDLVQINNQSFNYGFKINASDSIAFNALPIGQNLPTLNFSPSFSFQLDSAQIDTITLKEGKMHIVLTSTIPADFDILLFLPSVRKNLNSLSIPLQRSFNNTLPITIDTLIDLSNYAISLSNTTSLTNSFNAQLAFTLTKGSSPVKRSDSIDIDINFEGIRFRRIYGRFKEFQLTPTPDTCRISIFDGAANLGSIQVDNPKLVARVSNSFGVKIDASFLKFQGYNKLTNPNTINIIGSGVPTNFIIPSPTFIGGTSTTPFTLDTLNSNIDDVINNQPQSIVYQLKAKTDKTTNGYILDTSKFEVDMEVILPMSGSIKNFVFRDTVDYTFDKGDKIESLLFRTNVENGFPFETAVQVYFADSNATVLDSLVKDKAYEILLAAAPVDNTGRVLSGQTNYKRSDLSINAATMSKLSNVHKFIIEARLSSTNQGLMKIFDNYKLDVQLGVKAKLKL